PTSRAESDDQPSYAATFVCDAFARARRRSPRHPDDAWARGPVHHANLYTRPRAAHARRLRQVPSESMNPMRLLVLALVLGAAIISFSLVPSSARSLPTTPGLPAPIRGAMHIHTRRSDGTGTIDQVAAAAAQAGLSFVITTDHGDASREVEPPSY